MSGTEAVEASGGPAVKAEHGNLYAAFLDTVRRRGDALAVHSEEEGVDISWNQLEERVARIAAGLEATGVQPGDRVALVMGTRSEFPACDMAAVAIGALPFSIYRTLPAEGIRYAVEDSGTSFMFVEAAYLDKVREAVDGLDQVRQIVVVDGDGSDGVTTLAELEASGGEFDAAAHAERIQPSDPLTLIYTSGTTGPPKGVVLTHEALLDMIASVRAGVIDLPKDQGRAIAWLPAAHIAERAANYYAPMTVGMEVHICPDPGRVVEFLAKVRPTWFFAVPRVWEKLKAGLEAAVAGMPEEQRDGALAGLEAGISKVRLEQAGEEVPAELAAAVARADEQLFSKLRASLGLDNYVAVSLGAAPTPVEVLEFFHAIGIEIGELWGMSETCGVATVNRPGQIKLGTVGPPIPGCDLKLAEDGEILCRSPFLMREYLNKPEKTAEDMGDGWLRTGDIGTIDEDGYLTIIDRKKELIINASGKNMSPVAIESQLKAASPLIGSCVAIGDMRPYNVALVVLDPDFAPAWAAGQGIEAGSVEGLAAHPQVLAALEEAVEQANANLSRVEQIKRFTVLPNQWEPGGDELTPTMKLKRGPIGDRYADEIEALYVRTAG